MTPSASKRSRGWIALVVLLALLIFALIQLAPSLLLDTGLVYGGF